MCSCYLRALLWLNRLPAKSSLLLWAVTDGSKLAHNLLRTRQCLVFFQILSTHFCSMLHLRQEHQCVPASDSGKSHPPLKSHHYNFSISLPPHWLPQRQWANSGRALRRIHGSHPKSELDMKGKVLDKVTIFEEKYADSCREKKKKCRL